MPNTPIFIMVYCKVMRKMHMISNTEHTCIITGISIVTRDTPTTVWSTWRVNTRSPILARNARYARIWWQIRHKERVFTVACQTIVKVCSSEIFNIYFFLNSNLLKQTSHKYPEKNIINLLPLLYNIDWQCTFLTFIITRCSVKSSDTITRVYTRGWVWTIPTV